jgi:hypothetical protein
VLALVLGACAGERRVQAVSHVHVALTQDAQILSEANSALYAVIVAGGKSRRYHGSGFTHNAELGCYVATGWLDRASAATPDDHLRVELCPEEGGHFSVGISVAAGGTFFAIDRGRSRVAVSIDDDRSIVDVGFTGIDDRDHSVAMGVGIGVGIGVSDSDDRVYQPARFQGRIIGTIRFKP